MPLDDLQRVLAAPQVPLFPAEHQEWRTVESRLGTRFPHDYFMFCKTYGSGVIRGDIDTSLTIFNPAAPGYVDEIEFELQRLRDAKSHSGGDIPFDVYPDEGGLLLFGLDDCNVRLCWRTVSDPNLWPIVVFWQRGPEGYAQFDLPLVLFLTQLINRDLTIRCWPAPAFVDNIRFERFM